MKDIFISHASEDKELIVNPLVQVLNAHAISYWLDSVEIGWGDSIVSKINVGFSESKYVLVLISSAFLRKKWTKVELEAAFAAEVESGQKFLLPVLCAPADEIFGQFPLLRSKRFLALPTSYAELAAEISKVLGREYKKDWVHNHRKEYAGEVHITVLKHPQHVSESCALSIEWGHWMRKVKLSKSLRTSVSLMHTKGADGASVPLFVRSDKPVFVSFGEGSGNSHESMNINSRWLPVKW